MNPETVTTGETALRPAPGRENPLPEWVSTTDRNALPNVLNWASEAERPPIDGRVDVIRFGIPLGTGTAVGYFHRGGELGILVALDSVPALLDLPAGTNRAHFFGENITRLDQGDEPGNEPDGPAAPVQDVSVYKEEEAAEAGTAVAVPAPDGDGDTEGDVLDGRSSGAHDFTGALLD